jgi:hypothetical protein
MRKNNELQRNCGIQLLIRFQTELEVVRCIGTLLGDQGHQQHCTKANWSTFWIEKFESPEADTNLKDHIRHEKTCK